MVFHLNCSLPPIAASGEPGHLDPGRTEVMPNATALSWQPGCPGEKFVQADSLPIRQE